MKKQILRPKALFVAFFLFFLVAFPCFAENNSTDNFRFKIDSDGQFAMAKGSNTSANLLRNLDFRSNAKTFFGFDHKLNDTTTVSLETSIIVGTNSSFDEGESINLDGLHLDIKSTNFGKIELGITKYAAETLRVDGSTFAKGTGGVDGDIFRLFDIPYVPFGSSGYSPTYITVPRSPLSAGFANSAFLGNASGFSYIKPKLGYGDDTTALSYYSKRTNGFKFGFTYSPSTEDKQSTQASKNPLTLGANGSADSLYQTFFVGNITSSVLNYYNTFGAISLSSSLSFEHAKIKKKFLTQNAVSSGNGVNYISNSNINRNDINVMSIGANLEYLGFVIGTSYSNWGKSMYYTEDQSNKNTLGLVGSYYKTYGIGYAAGPYGISLTNMQSSFMNNVFTNTTLSTSYDIRINTADGSAGKVRLKHFVEISKYNFHDSFNQQTNQTINGTEGYAILTGIKLLY